MAEKGALDPALDIERSALLDGVAHGFFGSSGGVHQFGYGGPGDASAVRAMRIAAADAVLKGAPIVAPHQVHSPNVIRVDQPWPDNPLDRPVGDALVTAQAGIALGIVTADCGPVLFADSRAGVIGAAHAGWRGAHGGILGNTIAAMEELGARREDMRAVLGPTIAQQSYEVDAGFRTNFTAADERHFAPAAEREGKARWHFDLPGYIIAALEDAGIGHCADLGRDTFAEAERYHSYRRASRSGAPNYGRQISVIALA